MSESFNVEVRSRSGSKPVVVGNFTNHDAAKSAQSQLSGVLSGLFPDGTGQAIIRSLPYTPNVWGNDPASVDAEEFCPACEHHIEGHFTACPEYVRQRIIGPIQVAHRHGEHVTIRVPSGFMSDSHHRNATPTTEVAGIVTRTGTQAGWISDGHGIEWRFEYVNVAAVEFA